MAAAHSRRRIDRILSADYLHRIEERPAEEVRRLRDECRSEEAQLSYARRVLQAQIDIARTEAARRAGEVDDEELLARLPSILADPQTSARREARAVGVRIPDVMGRRAGEPDAADGALARLPDLSDAELADLIGRLREQEQRVSHQRRVVLECIDRLQDELVARYRNGGLAVDDIVARADGGSPSS